MSAKHFLLDECRNVRSLLDATLKNDYGLDGSRDFFEECDVRLQYITNEIEQLGDFDTAELRIKCDELNELARLICRIERSSLGEYSWPFVEELKRIATDICTERSLTGDPAKVYVLADGGLDAYSIFPEQKRPSASKRLILTIVFPKTLKDFVLLHSILGHEIGHAIWARPQHQSLLKTEVLAPLKEVGGVFENPQATAAHLFSTGAPDKVKEAFARMLPPDIDQTNLFKIAEWDAWVEEILCDLIGLCTFGPSFVAAQCSLLLSLDPSGLSFGESHPPVGWRINMVLRGASLLGHDVLPPTDTQMHESMQLLWKNLHSYSESAPWYDVFSDAQLIGALSGLQSLLGLYSGTAYEKPSFDEIAKLLEQLKKNVPPVGFEFDASTKLRHTDFRHILYAGWIASIETFKGNFSAVNRLCQHAIMQQCSIDLFRSTAK